MLTKTYKIKQMSKSMLIYVDGKPQRIEFNGGTKSNGGNGQFTTSNEGIQRAIESNYLFGNPSTHQIYIDGVFGEIEPKQLVQQTQEVPVIEEPKSEEPKQFNFQEAKKLLIEKGVSPDELKNMPQVKKKFKELGL